MPRLTAQQMVSFKGQYKIKNVSGRRLQLRGYGQYNFEVDEEIDLLDPAVPSTLRAADWHTAQNMVGYARVRRPPIYAVYELAQRIESGDLEVTEIVRNDPRMLHEM